MNMNKYLIFTTEGITYGPNTNVNIENCQILGTIEAMSANEAIKLLFEQNEWIARSGFTITNMHAYPILTTTIQNDIKNVMEYLWADEHKHFQENECPIDHIFCVLTRLKKIAY